VTSLTDAKRALPDPGECFFDRFQETPVCFMQADLKLCFDVGRGLVDRIAFPAPCSRDETSSFRIPDGQFAAFGKQLPLVPVQFSSVHFFHYSPRTDESGTFTVHSKLVSFQEGTMTLNVSAHSALLVLGSKLVLGQKVILMNLKNWDEREGTVAVLGPLHAGLTTVAIEFTRPAPEFWSISSPPKDWNHG
jgi:hypothetical protein